MLRGLFVTGTDTGVGKTVAAAALLHRYRSRLPLTYWKPIQTGIEQDDDTATVARLAACDPHELLTAGVRLERPVSPHLAARLSGRPIDIEALVARVLIEPASSRWIVEGAGGVLVPLGPRHDMLDVPKRLALPVALVVGVRLGCLSHALSAELAVRMRGLRLAGWIATRIDPAMAQADASVAALRERLPAPLLADLAGVGTPFPREALRLAGLPGGTC